MALEFDFNAGRTGGGDKGTRQEQGGERGNGGSTATGQSVDGSGRETLDPNDYLGTAKRRKGRQPYPRDENGNIIRPTEGTGPGEGTGSKTSAKVSVKFNPNNRDALRGSIQGMHAMAATLTSQPVFLLSDAKASELTDRLCDVLDYHKINITGDGGPWGLYLALALCGYGIYSPMLNSLATGGKQHIEGSTVAATPGDAKNANGRAMDFGADYVTTTDRTVSEAMSEEPPIGVFRYDA
jgi:hypothetical protein